VSEPSAFDRLHHSRAGGPTPADVESQNEQLRRENRELRRLLHEVEEERLDLLRLAETRDRGFLTTNDPRERP